jgi:hypothetical protein
MIKLTGIIFASIALLFQNQAAAEVWSITSFATIPGNVAKVIEATDAFIESDVGQSLHGRHLLQAAVADGDDPATHGLVSLFDTATDHEAFRHALHQSPEGHQLLDQLASVGAKPISTTLYNTEKSWGDINDTDQLWFLHHFNVKDRPRWVAAVEKFIASPTGQNAPFQVHLSSIIAGGLSPVNLVTTVGYASETEMSEWFATRNASDDWHTYLRDNVGTAEFLGSNLSRIVKRWEPAIPPVLLQQLVIQTDRERCGSSCDDAQQICETDCKTLGNCGDGHCRTYRLQCADICDERFLFPSNN